MDDPLHGHVAKAVQGDKQALEALVRGLKDDIYRLSLRMLGDVADAHDATQEILIKIITHMGSFRGESSVRTWAWKIAARHVLRVRKSRRDLVTDLAQIEKMIDSGAHASPTVLEDADVQRLAEDVRLGCTQAMLSSLKPAQRMVYILSDIFGLESAAGAEVLHIDAATFRKRLQRARALLSDFMERKCGMMNPVAACRCVRQIPVAMENGLVARNVPGLSALPRQRAQLPIIDAWQELTQIDRAARAFRERATELAPESLVLEIRSLLDTRQFRLLSS